MFFASKLPDRSDRSYLTKLKRPDRFYHKDLTKLTKLTKLNHKSFRKPLKQKMWLTEIVYTLYMKW